MNEKYIIELIKNGLRNDGRKFDEYRKPIKIETGISKNAEGSARVIIGETEVIVGIKLDVGEPFPDMPDEGSIIVNAELLPLSSPEFEPGPPDEKATELARVVDRGIRESKAIDFKKLAIREGELVWLVFIDVYTINNAGNLIDAAALAAVAALKEVRFPKLENDKVKFGEWTDKKLPLNKLPITCTLIKINDKIIIDADIEEENVADARMSVAICGNEIHAIQKGGEKGISLKDVNEMMDIAFEKSKELQKVLK